MCVCVLYLQYADLVELMMIQNAQMHQVIMNNMTMSALSSFGYTNASSGPVVGITVNSVNRLSQKWVLNFEVE